MATCSFERNAVVEINGVRYTLLRLLADDQWQLEAQGTGRTSVEPLQTLQSRYLDGTLKFVTPSPRHRQKANVDPVSPATLLHTLSEAAWEKAKERHAYVTAILHKPSTKAKVVADIHAMWRKLGARGKPPSASAVLRWKSLFLASGQSHEALLDKNQARGNRKPRYPRAVEEVIEQAIRDIYLTRERHTIERTIERARYLVGMKNDALPEAAQLKLPTRAIVTRMIQAIPAYDRDIARHGRAAAKKNFRAAVGVNATDSPLERAEIDHTQLDLYVIDDQEKVPLGRPWVTACIDDHTRCILGYHIGFEPPSYLSVAKCLKHAFLPKTEFLARHPEIKNDWPAHGVVQTLVVDNGREFHSKSLEKAAFLLGVTIQYAPKRTPWFKGKIERWFLELNRNAAHGIPGTTFSNIFEKDDYNPKKHAVVTWSTLQEIVATFIADVYHAKPHGIIGASPNDKWMESIEQTDIPLPSDPALLDALMTRSVTRKLTHVGVEMYGIQYNSRDLRDLRRRFGQKLTVEVRVDDEDLSSVLVICPKTNAIIRVAARNTKYASGLTLRQHKQIQQYAKIVLRKYGGESWLEAKERIAARIEADVVVASARARSSSRKVRARVVEAAVVPGSGFDSPSDQANAGSEPPDIKTSGQRTEWPTQDDEPPLFAPVFSKRGRSEDGGSAL